MPKEITITRNLEAEKECGVEYLNIGYRLSDGFERNECQVQIICELKFINDNKRKNDSFRISFAILDDKMQLIGTDFHYCEKKEYVKYEGIFSIYIDCNINKKKINCIKSYIRPR